MNRLRNMKIRTKLLTSFMLVIVLIATLVVVAATQIANVSDRYESVIRYPLALETALREVQAEFRDLRRIVTAIAFFAGDEGARGRFFSEAHATYVQANAYIDKAGAIVQINPLLTRTEKEARLAGKDALRGAVQRYHDEVILPLQEMRWGNREAAQAVVASAFSVAGAVTESINDMIDLASRTADSQVRRAAQDAATTITLIIVISVLAVLAAVSIALVSSNYVGNALAPLTEFMHSAATVGDITFRPEWAGIVEKAGQNRDELGRIVVAAGAFFNRIEEIRNILNRVAAGDLTSDFHPLSDHDSMGIALKKMQDNLGALCGAINAAVIHVSTGTSQVTSGAHILASGASQQAASIEDISNSMAAIAEGTQFAARMAEDASGFAGTIKGSAEAARSRMQEMLTASKQIGDAGEAIRAVVKMMDDIAFQTNVLSVNAAVEAAHAGVYGRGFTIVAKSVRELAMQSKAAANETGRLIRDSLEKTELGIRSAAEASDSLAAILAGIDENTRLVAQIAVFSGEQSRNIEQVTLGISQVSSVVRQNSVTAEESAAVSQEMSRQFVVLRRLVSQFKLNTPHSAIEPAAGVDVRRARDLLPVSGHTRLPGNS